MYLKLTGLLLWIFAFAVFGKTALCADVVDLKGAFDVNQMGASTYSIPIQIPPGVGGMQPSLALVYNSQSNNTVLGKGWQLSGLSFITRCAANIAQDNLQEGTVNLSDSDRFCLDGQKLLMVGGSLEYGTAGTEYRTELDTGTRVFSVGNIAGGPASFTVVTRNGTTITYGTSTNSTVIPVTGQAVLTWSQSTTTDLNGNSYTVNYENDSYGAILNYPSYISYTSNVNVGTAATNSIQFVYSNVTDPNWVGRYGAQFYQAMLLTNIQTCVGGSPANCGGGAPVLNYQLTYSQSTQSGNFLLSQVTAQSGDLSTSLLPVSFSYSSAAQPAPNPSTLPSANPSTIPATGLQASASLSAPYDGGVGAGNSGSGIYNHTGQVWLTGDFNGDGTTDFAQPAPGLSSIPICTGQYGGVGFDCTNFAINGTFGSSTTFVSGDFDGDGATDIAQIDTVNGNMLICYSTGNQGGEAAPFSCTLVTTGITGSSWVPITGDFNGDGRTDVAFVSIGSGTTSSAWVCLSGSRGVSTCTIHELNTLNAGGINFNPNLTTAPNHGMLTGDFDGDGMTDIYLPSSVPGKGLVCYGGADFACQAVSFGQGFASSTCTGGSPPAACSSNVVFAGDFNGDGLTDLATFDPVNSGQIDMAFSLGAYATTGYYSGSFYYTHSTTVVNSTGNNTTQPLALGDFSGNGRTDFVQASGSGGSSLNVCYSRGDGSFNCNSSLSNPAGQFLLAGNFTGQAAGQALLGVSSAWTNVQLLQGSTSPTDLLTQVTTGLGDVTTFSYLPLSSGVQSFFGNSGVYTKGALPNPAYPTVAIQNASFVVSGVGESNELGGNHTVQYHYAGAEGDLSGRGFLGFSEVDKFDLTANVSTATTYRQDFPYIGQVSSVTKTINGTVSNINNYTYQNLKTNSGLKFPYVSQEIDQIFEYTNGNPTSTLTTQNVYDNFGNLITTTTVTSDGYVKTRTNSVTNLTGNPLTGGVWSLGRVDSLSQTNTDPDEASLTRTSTFSYDSRVNLIQENIQPGGSSWMSRAFQYDAFGNRVHTQVTGAGMTTRASSTRYDSLGQFPVQITNAYNQSETRTYDPKWGVMTQFVDPNGLTTYWTYDKFGRKTLETRPDSTTTSVSFNTCTGLCSGYSKTIQASGQPSETIYYDLLDKEYLRVADGFGGQQIQHIKKYDTLGNLTSESRNYFTGGTQYYTNYAYDLQNRLVLETDPDGSQKTWVYNGLTTTFTNNKGQVQKKVTNSLGQQMQVTDNAGNVTKYAYDPFGNLTMTTDPSGNSIVIGYDVMGRKTTLIDPDLGTWFYVYNGAGDLLNQTDANGQTISMTYDNVGRMVSRTSNEYTTNWVYDTATHGIGKLASVSTTSGVGKTYTYDSFGRVIGEQSNLDTSYLISTAYDSNSRVSQITYPSGFSVTYQYDSTGHLTELDDASSGALYWKVTAETPYGQATQETFGSGVTTARTYDPKTERVTGIKQTSSGVTLQNLALSYDQLGNLTQRTDLINQYTGATLTDSFTYDGLNRLTSARNPMELKDYGYDALGDLTSKTDVGVMNYGSGIPGRPLHAVMSTSGPTQFTYTYDNNGNMLTGAGRSMAWTSFNKPSSIANASNTISFSYDGDFERYKEVETTCTDYLGNAQTNCIKYMVNARPDTGIHYEKEINGSITTYRNYLYAGSGNIVGVYTTRSDSSTQLAYFGKDHLGSVALSTDKTGSLIERLSYDPFGKRRNLIGTDDPSDLLRSAVTHQGLSMHEMLDDGGMGLIDMNARIYDPLLGRFMSPDGHIQAPFNLQSLNRYSYVMNNPVSMIDPSGNDIFDFLGGLGNDLISLGNDAIAAVTSAASTVAGALSSAGSAVGNFFSQNGVLIGEIVGIAAVSILTAGAVDYALAAGLGAFGAAVVSGAVAGAVSGALSSAVIGGHFSWQAVAVGALTGAVSGGISTGIGGAGAGAGLRIAAGAAAGGASQWLAGAVQGHASFASFVQGAITGGVVSAALVGIQYLTSNSETSATQSPADDSSNTDTESDVNRSPAMEARPEVGDDPTEIIEYNNCVKVLTAGYATTEVLPSLLDGDVSLFDLLSAAYDGNESAQDSCILKVWPQDYQFLQGK